MPVTILCSLGLTMKLYTFIPVTTTCVHLNCKQTTENTSHQPPATIHPVCSRRQAISLLALSVLSTANFAPARTLAEYAQNNEYIKLPCTEFDCRPVEVHDYRIGTGAQPQNGSKVVLKWTGRLADRYGWPIQKEDADEVSFVIGKDRLIEGFEQGLMGMREGGKRRMLIPAEKGYQDEKSQPLPANFGDRRRLFATVLNPRRFKRAGDLVIDVQLLKVRSAT